MWKYWWKGVISDCQLFVCLNLIVWRYVSSTLVNPLLNTKKSFHNSAQFVQCTTKIVWCTSQRTLHNYLEMLQSSIFSVLSGRADGQTTAAESKTRAKRWDISTINSHLSYVTNTFKGIHFIFQWTGFYIHDDFLTANFAKCRPLGSQFKITFMSQPASPPPPPDPDDKKSV